MTVDILREVLNGKLIEYHNDTLGLINYSLCETDKSATLKIVHLLNIPSDCIILQLDTISTNSLFNGIAANSQYENSRCDYLIVTNTDIYFIELKSHKNAPTKRRSECIGKFRASLCLTKYIDEVISIVRQKQKVFASKNAYYVLIYQNTPIDKTITSLKPKSQPTSPDKFLEIPVANNSDLYFKELLG